MSDDGLRAALVAIKAKLQKRSDDGEAHLFLNVPYWELEELLAEYPADSPHLTDDGAAAPGGAPGNASAFGPSTGATPTAAPSSLPSITDAMVEAAARKRAEHYESEYDSTHLKWQDFAGEAREILEAAFGEGATPAIDRMDIEDAIRDEFMRFGAPEISDDARSAADAVWALLGGTS